MTYRDWTTSEQPRFTRYRLPRYLENLVDRTQVEHPIDTCIQLVFALGKPVLVLLGVWYAVWGLLAFFFTAKNGI